MKAEWTNKDTLTSSDVREQIIRCKDCKYNVENMQIDPLDITDYTDIVCSYFMTDGMEPDDFCSKGEHRYNTRY